MLSCISVLMNVPDDPSEAINCNIRDLTQESSGVQVRYNLINYNTQII